jgi:N-acetylmuramoyl-L-alanine amidase
MKKLILSLCILIGAASILQATAKKEFVIVIQAGHGGTDNGVKAVDGTLEKDLTLSYAKELQKIANENDFKVIMCREDDKNFDLSDRMDIVKQNKADLVILLHFNSNMNDESNRGMECYVGSQTNLFENKILGKFMGAELYTINGMKFNGVNTKTMLSVNTIPSPVALLELGYMTNEKDLSFIKTEQGKQEICQKILNAIVRYKAQMETNK